MAVNDPSLNSYAQAHMNPAAVPRDPPSQPSDFAPAGGPDPQHQEAAILSASRSSAPAPTPQAAPAQQPLAAPDSNEGDDYLRWDEVVKQREFLHMPVYQQELARKEYFKTIVAPRVNPDDLPAVRKDFDAQTTGAAGMALIPNNDDYNIEARQQQSQALQQKYGLSQAIADKVAYAMYPQKDSRTHIVGAQVAEGAKVFIDKVGEHIGIPFTNYDLLHAANYITGTTPEQEAIDKEQAKQNPKAALGGSLTGGALGLGAAGHVLGAGRAALAGYAERSAQMAKAAEDAKFATTSADEILAKDAAANPPKVDPSNPFNSSGLGEGVKSSKDAGWSGFTTAQAEEIAKSPALQKAVSFVRAHPAFTTGAAIGTATGGFGLFPQASLIYHIARSIKGIAKLLPEVTSGGAP